MCASASKPSDGNVFTGQVGASGSSAAPSASAGREAASPRLESDSYNRTHPSGRVVFLPCRCECRTCPDCGRRYGFRVRQGLLAKQGMFRKLGLLTLTVDRENFESPEAAFEYVSENGLIRRLMKYLQLELWVWVLEFQQLSGTGWPHWHILIDLSDVPGRKVDLKKAWRLWRDKWGLGGLDLEVRVGGFESNEHAINYLTKYLIKQPGLGYPAWVLKTVRRMHFFDSSGKVGAILNTSKPRPAKPNNVEAKKKRQGKRSFVERMAECSQLSRAFYRRVDPHTGEPYLEFLGSVDVRPDRLVWLSRMGELQSPVQIERHQVTFENGNSIDEVRPFLVADGKSEGLELLERLSQEVERRGETKAALDQITERYHAILENNVFARREREEGSGDIPF